MMAIEGFARRVTTFSAVLSVVIAMAIGGLTPLSQAAARTNQNTQAASDAPEPNHSGAGSINDDGWIVGSATSSDGPYTQHPVLWQPETHEIVDLGTLDGYDWGGASDINESGQIVGSFGTWDDGLAFVRQPETGTMTDLGTLGGASATATDINGKGQIVGSSATASGARRPFIWRPGTGAMENLGTLGDQTHSMAVGITDDSTVLGMAWTPSAQGTKWHAWLWKPGADHLIRLENQGLPESTRPEDINNRGQVVGCTWRNDAARTAVLWRPTSERTVRLESLGGTACASALNDSTEIVGWSVNSQGNTRAFVWTPDSAKMTSLGTMGGPSAAHGINGDGVVVGSFGDSTSSHAFVWHSKNGHMVDLGLLVSNCRASNLTAGGPVGPDLQAVIDAADSGDTVQVAGECQGSYSVLSKDLTLVGAPAPGFPMATLDGKGEWRVLYVGGDAETVELRDLLVTHGWFGQGGGIHNDSVALRLTGTTSVTDNAGPADKDPYSGASGGGVYNRQGTVEMADTSTISKNSTESGGGIFSYEGDITLSGSSSITGNTATQSGGGITSYRNVVTIQDSASITGNSAGSGGGISKNFGPVRLLGTAVVADNTATSSIGGGIFNTGRIAIQDTASVTGNRAATKGGGIYVGGGPDMWGQLLMSGTSTVTGNVAKLGGGIYSTTEVILEGASSVTLNTATLNGGGLFNDGGTVTLLDTTTIVDNIPNDCVHCR